MKHPRILMADDHSIVLAGLRKLVEAEGEVVGTVEDGRAHNYPSSPTPELPCVAMLRSS